MSDVIISVEGLGKKYVLSHQEVLDILDGKIPDDFYEGLRQATEGRLVPMEQVMERSES